MITVDNDQSALRCAAADPRAALCTIVGIDGSFSRQLGAQLAIAGDGSVHGSLADGCLEQELAAQARALAGGAPQVLRFGKGSPFIDFRLPCGSGLDILIDPAPDRAALRAAVAALDARRPVRLPLPGAEGFLAERGYRPAPRILAFGRGPERDRLADLAAAMGIACERFGPDTGEALGRAPSGVAVDAWTAVVLLFHDHEWEPAVLDWALATEAFYIGAIGGEPTRAARIERLRARGVSEAEIARVRGPIGLIPQARDAAVLALSILADVVGAYAAAGAAGR